MNRRTFIDRPHARPSAAPRSTRTIAFAVAAVVVAAVLLGLAVTAYAFLTAGGSGGGTASIATLPAPTITSVRAGSASATLEWSDVTAPGSGSVSYYVTRDGGTPAGSCPAEASPSAVTSCTDTGLSLARHTYTVTAVWRSWTGTSDSSSVTVTLGPAVELAFTTQPSSSTGGVAFPTQPVVAARDANRNVVTDYSGTVTLSILRGGAAGAALSECSASLVNGVTSFSGCKIDRSSASQYFLRARDGTLTADSGGFTISTGSLAQFRFTTQPGNGTGGNELSTQPVVAAADAGGNTVTSYSGTVRLAVVPGTGTAGAVLSACQIDARSAGTTTFDNCEIDRAGTGYRLRASDGAITGDSNAFNVTVGSIDDIVFTTQPGGGATGGTAFPTQPVVTGIDDGGNTVTSYASVPALTISSGTGTLSGCRGTNASGVVTYTGCTIDRAGSFRLRADDGPRDDTSSTFTVSVGALARLAFTAQPSTATAGQTFGTSPIVVATDAGGNTVAGYSGTVTLTVERDPSVLTGCATTGPRSGATTFTGCRLSRSGSGWVLHASDGTLEGDSSSITVSAGSATQLAFTTQPGDATANASFGTQPVVTALDGFGNVATTYGGTVSLAIRSGTGTAGATLSNCSGNRVAGVTTFSSCRINRLGTGYVLRASDNRGLPSVDSAAFDVVVGRAAGFVLQATSTSLTAGVATDLTITARDAGGNVDTTYTGVKSLRFGGAGRSPAGSSPTVTNNAGTAIAFGSTTTIEFVDGVARASGGANGAMVLRAAGSDSITVDEASFDEEDQLDVTVAAGTPTNLAWTDVDESTGTLSSPCLFVCTNSSVNSGSTFNANVSVTDVDGNTVSNIGSGHTVRVAVTSAGGSFTAPTSGSSVSLSFPSTGLADSTVEFTFRTQTSGTWTTNAFRADTSAGTVYTTATATMVN